MTALEYTKVRRYKILVLLCLDVWRRTGRRDIPELILRLLLVIHRYSTGSGYEPVPRPLRRSLLIENLSESDAWNFTRFRKADLARLLINLQLPRTVALENGTRVQTEELFLFGLMRLSCTCPTNHLVSNDHRESFFARELSQCSRMFSKFLWLMVEKAADFLFAKLSWWSQYFREFSDAIRRKILDQSGIVYARNIVGFIDCTINVIERVGAGPENRHQENSNEEQRSYYSGYKKIHGLKFQSLDCPLGMTMDLRGPVSARRNDLFIFRISAIADRLRQISEDAGLLEEEYFSILGDGIYPNTACVVRRIGESPTDRALSKVRIAVEWDYGSTKTLFPYLDYKKNMALKHSNTPLLYLVATFFRNCHIACYGSNAANYFRLTPPSLEKYLGIEEE
jgi:hypothetical protein